MHCDLSSASLERREHRNARFWNVNAIISQKTLNMRLIPLCYLIETLAFLNGNVFTALRMLFTRLT